ncbi:MATE family efflux transporter [Longimicrobium sp.]|uniref:MATE family efflux transporter n=1 Tax=Longimicrobium sp. TaxID=2029185 RepID=UPI002E35AEAF|nr:MATE family efflux transporter [Longimicrobium sp.]HEX6041359.1 MATE family efflux transporter [Longimicrobium sp.]
MKDLTTGPVSRHLLATTGFMLVMMVFQTLYFLIDLYWVGRLGTSAVAGVSVAGQLSFVVLALSQMLGVGATTLVSHAAGRRDATEAGHVFNQAIGLSLVTGAVMLVVGLAGLDAYTRAMSADAATAAAARAYLGWFLPAMALQFPLGVMSAALRGTGQFRAPMVVSTVSIVMNMALAPFLIFGWGTGRPMGVAGAAISSLVSIVVATAWLATHFVGERAWIRFSAAEARPRMPTWRRLLGIGLPSGFEFAMMALYQAVVYTLARPFGAAEQAGFGIGMRVIQATFMPVVALGFAVAPVAGQNVGAGLPERVRAVFRDAALMATGVMLVLTIAVNLWSRQMVQAFSADPAVVRAGTVYLEIIAWNFVASGMVFVASSLFQALGNTIPSLVSSATRMAMVIIPALLLARLPGFHMTWIWILSAATVWVQLGLSLALLRREFARRFGPGSPAVPLAAAGA